MKLSDILKITNNGTIQSFSGTVIKGQQIGREIGFPTANLDISDQDVQLNRGVYGVKVLHDNFEYYGIMNVGTNPTFNSDNSAYHYEVHIFDFNKNIYGDIVKIDACFYMRMEISFENIN
ncbi:riboflavin kinase [Bacillus sp. B15-48]|uniref:riboflavin kinase n=1 Tax=Bacillus sp. B15-48 TaxID=1548601 RepID=UPI00193F1259